MKLEKVKISTLIPDPSNARKHDQKNLDAIKGSLAKFGQQKPLVVDYKNIVIAGNGTLAAAKELGWEEIDIVRTDLKGSELTAYGLADNRTSDMSSFDTESLSKLLDSLRSEDFDLDSIGFDDSFFDNEKTKEIKSGKELDESDFSNFDHQCPKCGFEFNDNP